MNDTDLIGKIQMLKTVESDQEWLVLARKSMLARLGFSGEPRKTPLFVFDFLGLSSRTGAAIAGFLFIVAASGTLTLASNSLPGDPLYGAKLASEKVQNSLPASPVAQAQRQEATAQRRVDELAQIAHDFNLSSNMGQRSAASALTQQIDSYQQTLQKNTQALNQGVNSADGQSQKTDLSKVKDEANVIQQSAQTLAIVLHQSDTSADMEKALRTTVTNRLSLCKDQQMYDQIQKLLSSGEVADLIQANELSVRCTEAD